MATLTQKVQEIRNDYSTLENKVLTIEHTLQGNGAIGIYDQLKEIREEQHKLLNDFGKFKQRIIYMGIAISIIIPSSSQALRAIIGELLK